MWRKVGCVATTGMIALAVYLIITWTKVTV